MRRKTLSAKANILEKSQISKCGWIFTNIYRIEPDTLFERTIVCSPSSRYALIKVTYVYGSDLDKILIYDLVERKVVQTINNKLKFVYWYWLDENTISLLAQCYDTFKYHRRIYKRNLRQSFNMKLIDKTVIPFHGTDKEEGFIPGFLSKDSCRLTIQGHDFLLLKMNDYVLIPYNTMSLGPHLPSLRIDIHRPLVYQIDTDDKINGRYSVSPHYSFTYKNKIFFSLFCSDQSGRQTDRFLQLDITDIDLNERKAIYKLDRNNAVIFTPRKLNKGSYVAKVDIYERFTYWQEGSIVLFNHLKDQCSNKAWILDLEKETIFEKEVNIYGYNAATIYRDYLLLWKESAKTKELRYKFYWIGHKTPKLSDLCTVKLLQQAVIDPLFIEKHNLLVKY